MAITIKKGHFSGLGHVFTAEDFGLTSVVRALAASVAVLAVKGSTLKVVDDLTFTDNSTGTPGAEVVDIPLPAASATVASGSTGAALSGLNTALGKTENALKVINQLIGQVRTVIDQPSVTVAVGAVATAGTIPAQDKTSGAGASGTSAADFASAREAIKVAKSNVYKTALAVDETLTGLGFAGLPIKLKADLATPLVVADIPTVSAAAAGGVKALLKVDADAALLGLANDIASIASVWNAQIAGVTTAKPLVVVG